MRRYQIPWAVAFWIALLSWVIAFGDSAAAQQKQPVTSIQPDVVVFFNISVASSGAQATPWLPTQSSPPAASAGTSLVIDNHQAGAYAWTVVYASHGFGSLSLAFQSAPDNAGGTGPGTWSTVAVSAAADGGRGINPNTSIISAATTTQAYMPWARMNLTAKTNPGSVKGVLYGFKINAAGGNGGGGAGGCPAGLNGEVQYNNAGVCGGDAHSSYNSGTGTLTFDTGGSLVALANNAMGAQGGVNGGTISPGWNDLILDIEKFLTVPVNGFAAGTVIEAFSTPSGAASNTFGLVVDAATRHANAQNITQVGGAGITGTFDSTAAHTAANVFGVSGSATITGAGSGTDVAAVRGYVGNTGIGTATNMYHFWAPGDCGNSGGGTVTNCYGAKMEPQTGGTNNFSYHANQTAGVNSWAVYNAGTAAMKSGTTTFAALVAYANGAFVSCSDCTVTSGIDNTCAASGSGAFAQRINGAWKCSI
jgi:hypothetical protein